MICHFIVINNINRFTINNLQEGLIGIVAYARRIYSSGLGVTMKDFFEDDGPPQAD